MTIRERAIRLASRPYPYVIHKDETADPSIAYLAENIDLEGCMAQGGSVEEAIQNLADARVDYIAFLLEMEELVPGPSSDEDTSTDEVPFANGTYDA